jgi:hypothetical protein
MFTHVRISPPGTVASRPVGRTRAGRRLAAALAVAVTFLMLAGTSATAAVAPPTSSKRLARTLGELWTTTLGLPNTGPFNGGSICVSLPHGELGAWGPGSCTVKRGTKLFVWPYTTECSTFAGDCGGPMASYSQLLSTAEGLDAIYTTHTLSLDGVPVRLTEVVTAPLHVALGVDNVFNLPAGTPGLAAAHGWVALLKPLRVGTHEIVVHLGSQTYGDQSLVTTINVVR